MTAPRIGKEGKELSKAEKIAKEPGMGGREQMMGYAGPGKTGRQNGGNLGGSNQVRLRRDNARERGVGGGYNFSPVGKNEKEFEMGVSETEKRGDQQPLLGGGSKPTGKNWFCHRAWEEHTEGRKKDPGKGESGRRRGILAKRGGKVSRLKTPGGQFTE